MIYVGYALAAMAYLFAGIVVARIYYVNYKDLFLEETGDGNRMGMLVFIPFLFPVVLIGHIGVLAIIILGSWMIDTAIKLFPERSDDSV